MANIDDILARLPQVPDYSGALANVAPPLGGGDADQQQAPPPANPLSPSGVFADIPDLSAEMARPSALGVFGRSVERGVLPALATMAGSGAGMAGGGFVGGPPGAFVGGLGLGVGSGLYAAKLQSDFLQAHPELAKFLGQDPETQQADIAARPLAALGGEATTMLATGRPSLSGGAAKILKGAATGAAVGGAVNTGQNLVLGNPAWEGLPQALAFGAFANKPWLAGSLAENLGARAVNQGLRVPIRPGSPLYVQPKPPPPSPGGNAGAQPPPPPPPGGGGGGGGVQPGQPRVLGIPTVDPLAGRWPGQPLDPNAPLTSGATLSGVSPDLTAPLNLHPIDPTHPDISNGAPPPTMSSVDLLSPFVRPGSAALPGGPSSIERVDPYFAQRIAAAIQMMPPNIAAKFAIDSGFRDQHREDQVYAEKHPGQPVPQNSQHGKGLAIDIVRDPDVQAWINAHQSETGIGFPIQHLVGEDNHLEPLDANGNRYGAHTIPQSQGGPAPNPGTTPTAPEAMPGERFGQAVDFFVAKGLTRDQAIGVVSRLHAESGLDPNNTNSIGATGIAQWLDRRPAMEAAGAKGDFQKQLEYIWQEFQGSEADAFGRIKASQTAADAARAMEFYERAGIPKFTESAAQLAARISGGDAGFPAALHGSTVPSPAEAALRKAVVGGGADGLEAGMATTGDVLGGGAAAPTTTGQPPATPVAAAADTPVSRAIEALTAIQPGVPMTHTRLRQIGGVDTRGDVEDLRAALVQRGLITLQNGRYIRADTINQAPAMAPTDHQAAELPQEVKPVAPVAEAPPLTMPGGGPPLDHLPVLADEQANLPPGYQIGHEPGAGYHLTDPTGTRLLENEDHPLGIADAAHMHNDAVNAEAAKLPTPPLPEAPAAPATDGLGILTGFGNMAKGMMHGLYQGFYDELAGTATSKAFRNDPEIPKLRPFFDSGFIKSPEDIRALIANKYDPEAAGLSAPEAAPVPAAAAAQLPEGYRLQPTETGHLQLLRPDGSWIAEGGSDPQSIARFVDHATRDAALPQRQPSAETPRATAEQPPETTAEPRATAEQPAAAVAHPDLAEEQSGLPPGYAIEHNQEAGTYHLRDPNGQELEALPEPGGMADVARMHADAMGDTRFSRPLPVNEEGLTPEHVALRGELHRLLKQIAPSLRLKTAKDLMASGEPIHGRFDPAGTHKNFLEHLAQVALSGPDPIAALHHEIVHFFRAVGMFTKGEWAALTKHADQWRAKYKIDERYPGETLGYRREEAIADAAGRWRRGEEQVPPGIRRVFQKMQDFLERVGNFLKGRGYQSASDVFAKMHSGEIGARPPGEPTATGERFARRPTPTGPVGTDPDEVALTSREILSPETPARRANSVNVEPIAAELEQRGKQALQNLGVRPSVIKGPSPRTDEIVSRAIASEVKDAAGRQGHALDWYTGSVREAMRIASAIHPELATDPNARTAFRAALAITSQGENVRSNVRLTDIAYAYFKEHGRFPTDLSAKDPAINANLTKFNRLLEIMGPEGLRNFLHTEYTVRDLEAMTGSEIGGELKGTRVYGSAVFGPKIGQGFYQNLSGNFTPVTMDLWFMRAWGRLTGTLTGMSPEARAKQRQRLVNAVQRTTNQRVPTTTRALVRIAEAAVLRHERDFKAYRSEYDDGTRKKSELTYASERFLKGLHGINETPSSGGQRNWMRARVDRARELLAGEGMPITNADLQALWWYPEKDLYSKMGGKDSEGLNTNYATAFRDLARQKGLSDAAVEQAPAVGAVEHGPRPAGAPDVGGAAEAVRGGGEAPAGEGSSGAAETGPLSPRTRLSRPAVRAAQGELTPEERAPHLSYELDPGEGAPFKQRFPEWDGLSDGQKTQVTREVLPHILDEALSITGARETARIEGLGGWHEYTNPAFKSRLVASPEVAGDVADVIGYLGQQTKVFGYRWDNDGDKLGVSVRDAPTGRGKFLTLADPDVVNRLWQRVVAEHPDFASGFSPSIHQGRHGIEILLDQGGDEMAARIKQELVPAIDRIAGEMGLRVGVQDFKAGEQSREHDWTQDPGGGSYLSRLSARYGPAIRDRLELFNRQELEPRIDAAIARAQGRGAEPAGPAGARPDVAAAGPARGTVAEPRGPPGEPGGSADTTLLAGPGSRFQRPDFVERRDAQLNAEDRDLLDRINAGHQLSRAESMRVFRDKQLWKTETPDQYLDRTSRGLSEEQRQRFVARASAADARGEQWRSPPSEQELLHQNIDLKDYLGANDNIGPDTRFSRPLRGVESDQEYADYARLVNQGDLRTLKQKGQDLWTGLKQNFGTRFKQGAIDRQAGRALFERELNGGQLLDHRTSPTEEARRAAYTGDIVQSVMGLPRGNGTFAGGMVRFSPTKGTFEKIPGSQALLESARPIWQKGLQVKTGLYLLARRSQDLMQQGRENLVKRGDLQYLNLAQQHPEIAEFARQYDKFQNQLMDFAEWGGTLDKATRAKFGRNYVPYYRIDENGDPVQSSATGGGQHIRSGMQKLTGGEAQVNDLWDNIFHNANMIMARAIRNHAEASIFDIGNGVGGVTPMSAAARAELRTPAKQAQLRALGQDPVAVAKRADQLAKHLYGMQQKNDPKLVSFMKDGKPTYYYVENPLLLRSIRAFGPMAVHPVIKALGIPAHLLTRGVTSMPDFMLRNLTRDTVSAQALTPSLKFPGSGTFKGLVDAYRNSDALLEMMAAGGGGGHGMYYHQNISPFRKQLQERLPQSLRDRILNSPKKLLDAYEHIGKSGEQANRLAIFQSIKKSGDVARAAAEARDILPFAQHGDSQLMQTLITLVPFLNARVQGLNRMYRGFKETPATLALRGGLLTAATAALWYMNKDDERYKQMPDYARQNYYHLMGKDFHYMLPMPFEHGAIFSTIPEIMLNYLNNGSTKEALGAATAMIKNQLNFDPVPQAVHPLLDLYANKNSFTGAPIVTPGEEKLESGLQVSPQTSRVIAAAGGALNVSPAQLDYAIKAYGGGLGIYALAAADALGEQAGLLGPTPSTRLDRLPIISSFYRQEPEGANRDINDFYDLSTSLKQLHDSINLLGQQGRGEEAAALATRNPMDTGLYPSVTAMDQSLAGLRKSVTAINAAVANHQMTPEAGRETIDQLTAARNQIGAQGARQLNRLHEGYPP